MFLFPLLVTLMVNVITPSLSSFFYINFLVTLITLSASCYVNVFVCVCCS